MTINIADLPAVRQLHEREAAAAAKIGGASTFNVAELPAVKAHFARAAAPAQAIEYAQAPDASGPTSTGVRPPAMQGSTR